MSTMTSIFDDILAASEKYPNTHGPFSYGTAGFRTTGENLHSTVFRMGIISALRSKKLLGSAIGVMITASHNKEGDNGIKLVDPMGEMLSQAWENYCTLIANAADSQELLKIIKDMITIEDINIDRPSTVLYACDTRPTSESLVTSLEAGLKAIHAKSVNYGVVTTPQLHFFVRCTNTANSSVPYGVPSVQGYNDKMANAYKAFLNRVQLDGIGSSPLKIDCANGVGAPQVKLLLDAIGKDYLPAELYNTDVYVAGKLNVDCGADHVKVNKAPPSSMPMVVGERYCSFDGDADRLLYFYLDENKNFKYLDGDKISSLIAMHLKDLLQTSGLSNIKLGVVQTAYANGSSTRYIRKSLQLPVSITNTGVKYLHAEAENFDIGIYFEANGHGSVLFSKNAVEIMENADPQSPAQMEAINKLKAFRDLVNEAVGDAMSDMLLVEGILATKKWTLEYWDQMYIDLPNRLMKVTVADRNLFQTTNAEQTLVSPPGLQQKIDELIMMYTNGRSFVRPSGTEDAVRIFAEAMSPEDAYNLAIKVCCLVYDNGGVFIFFDGNATNSPFPLEFLGALESVRPKSRYKIVVVDNRSLKVLGSILKLSEILEFDVLRIDSIEKRRKPEPEIEALYFLTPSLLNIDQLIQDFSNTGQHQIKGGLMTYSEKTAPNLSLEIELIAKKIVNVCHAMGHPPKINYFHQGTHNKSNNLSRQIAFFVQTEIDKSFKDRNPVKECNFKLLIVDRCLDMVAPLLHEFTYEAMAIDLVSDQIKFEKNIPSYTYLAQLGNGDTEERTAELSEKDHIWTKYRYEHISDAQEMMMKEVDNLAQENQAILNLQSGAKQNIHKLRDVVGAMPKFKALMAEYSAHISLMQNCMKNFNSLNLAHIGLIEQNLVTSITPEKSKYTMGSFDVSQILTDSSVDEALKYRVLLIYLFSNPNLSPEERSHLALKTKLNRVAYDAVIGSDMIIPFETATALSKRIEKECTLAIQKFQSSNALKLAMKPSSYGWSKLSSVSNQQPKASASPLMSLRSSGKSYGTPPASSPSSRVQTPKNASPVEEKEPYDVSRYVPVIKSVVESAILGCLDSKNFPSVVPETSQSPEKQLKEPISTNVFKKSGSTPYSGRKSSVDEPPKSPVVIKSLRSTKPSWQKSKSASVDPQPQSSSNLSASASSGYRSSTNSSVQPGANSQNAVDGSASLAADNSSNNGQKHLIIYVAGGITYSEIRTIRLLAAKYNYPLTIGSSHIIDPNNFINDLASIKSVSDLVPASNSPHGNSGINMESAPYSDPSCLSIGYATPPGVDPLASFNRSREQVSLNAPSSGNSAPGKGNNNGKSVEEVFMEKFNMSEKKWNDIKSGTPDSKSRRSESLGVDGISSMHRITVSNESSSTNALSKKEKSSSQIKKEKTKNSSLLAPPQQKKGFFKKLL
ncbi:Phosphoacetylglucosamine mutase [Smittium mucronatum]|uniref:phosphoacetylglucosamine mutase n=1 Tax=Smittium mucronatum TaxID=133383 RepID=A0A1R0H0G8_9FUNG|nr:Phosphoacetylglucosamine mutase [Smittium mucronatum]